MKLLAALFTAFCLAGGSQPPAGVDPDKLLVHLQPAYSRPSTFTPAALRFPLRLEPLKELNSARAEVERHPEDLEVRRRVAQLAEQTEDDAAEERWREVLEVVEPQLRKKPTDPTLLERQVEAMIGADLGARVVPAAEKLLATAPQSWRTHLLYGDARLRRADFNWRVCVRLGDRGKSAPQFAELVGDLAAAEAAYRRAAESAPAELAVRGARFSLTMAREVMRTFLPGDALGGSGGLDALAMRKELMEVCRISPGKVGPLWHTTHFLATFGEEAGTLDPQERSFLQQALAAAQPASPADRIFLAEARGMWAVALNNWAAARDAFEAARMEYPGRDFAAAWTALCDARSGEHAAVVIDRVRSRLMSRESTEDYALLGLLLGRDAPNDAIEALRKAIDRDVDNANARYNLALLLLRRRPDSAEARHHLRLTLQTEPDNLEARLAHAVTLALDGNLDAARRQLEGLRNLPQADKSLKGRLDAVLEALGKPAPPTG